MTLTITKCQKRPRKYNLVHNQPLQTNTKLNSWLIARRIINLKIEKPVLDSYLTCALIQWQTKDSERLKCLLETKTLKSLQLQYKHLFRTIVQFQCQLKTLMYMGKYWPICRLKRVSSQAWQLCSWWATETQLKAVLALRRKHAVIFLGWPRSTAPTRLLL